MLLSQRVCMGAACAAWNGRLCCDLCRAYLCWLAIRTGVNPAVQLLLCSLVAALSQSLTAPADWCSCLKLTVYGFGYVWCVCCCSRW